MVFGVLSLLGKLPLLGIIVVGIFAPLLSLIITSILTLHPYMLGIRIGLRVRGFDVDAPQSRLLGGSIGYGIIEGIFAFILGSALVAAGTMFVGAELLRGDLIDLSRRADPLSSLSQEITLGTLTVLSVLSSLGIRCCVPRFYPRWRALSERRVGKNSISLLSMDLAQNFF